MPEKRGRIYTNWKIGRIMDTKNLKEAMFFDRHGSGKVKCRLCPHECKVSEGKEGICRVRKNIGGTLYATTYQKASAIAVDPIEKKPLYHFYPGSPVLSYGSIGCNLRCLYCQNYHISQVSPDEYFRLRDTGGQKQVVNEVIRRACDGVAFTYNEPTIWYEFMYDIAPAVKEKGFYTVLVSNGHINPEPLSQFSPHIDAANIDLKTISDKQYMSMSKAHIQPVFDTINYLKEVGVLVELTNLVVTDFNDSEEQIRELCRWVVKNPGPDTPVHFTRYHPEYQYSAPATSLDTMKKTYEIAQEEGLQYIYVGNTPMRKYNNTHCHNCGETVISREKAYARRLYTFDSEGKVICPSCKITLPIVDKKGP